MRFLRSAVLVLAAGCGGMQAAAQPAPPPAAVLAERAAERFPQPVLVGDLIGRQVLRHLPSQPTLGWVRNVVRTSGGNVEVIVDYGGWFGVFDRPIAVPVEAMTLLGEYMEIVELTPEQLDTLATYDGAGASPVPHDEMIQVGLGYPAH
ncbi:hypothetical protein [Marinivivus vitaminiproducens]|uniref:hypothetical protein n=1 Tax=Marinivivus vitaminiproducens TaxID=3035935 RepID=UPI0027A7ACC4|nr:hypothetical protein P4R82_12335 [Geminicoccaceae bacterium SCSIO 64248]